MFITLTINTTHKNKNSVKLRTNKINPANGWRKAINAKKRGLWQRVKASLRPFRGHGKYSLNGQAAMF